MPLSTTNKKLCSELEGSKNQILCKEWETLGSSALNRHSPSSSSNRCSENSAEEEEERTLRPGGWRTSWKKVSLTHCWQTSQELTEVEAACTELSLVWYKVLYCYIITSSLGFFVGLLSFQSSGSLTRVPSHRLFYFCLFVFFTFDVIVFCYIYIYKTSF